jgi:hypothetical protein
MSAEAEGKPWYTASVFFELVGYAFTFFQQTSCDMPYGKGKVVPVLN